MTARTRSQPSARNALVLVALLAVGAVAGWVALRAGGAALAVPDMNDPQRIAAGQIVYAQHCAACHGAELEGQPNWTVPRADGRLPAPPHDDSGHTWHHPFDQLFEITKFGMVPPNAPENYASDMPAFGDRLTDAQIWAVLAYIRSRWSPEVRSRHDELQRQIAAQRSRRH